MSDMTRNRIIKNLINTNALLLTNKTKYNPMKNLIFSLIWLFAFVSFQEISNAQIQNYPDPINNPESSLMLAGDWFDHPHDIDFDNLPKIPSEHSIVSDVRYAGGRKVNQHNYLVYYEGRYWAMWTDGTGIPQKATAEENQYFPPGHELTGQMVSYSTSKDGVNWTEPRYLTVPPDIGFGWIARGFWVREGKLLALVSRFNAPPPYDEEGNQMTYGHPLLYDEDGRPLTYAERRYPEGVYSWHKHESTIVSYSGEGLQLHAFKMVEDGGECQCFDWKHVGIVYDNALNNFPPKKLPNGEWMMSRRDKNRDVHMMAGGIEAIDRWQSFPVIGYQGEELRAEEPYWWVLPDGKNLVALFRDNTGSGYIFRAFSTDNGRTWSRLVRTNYPSAPSKFNGLRLDDGRYVLVSNPNPTARRELILAISDDGMVFNKMGYLVGERHVDYPHVIVHDEHLYVAFAGAKQSVEVLKIKISDLDDIDMSKMKDN